MAGTGAFRANAKYVNVPSSQTRVGVNSDLRAGPVVIVGGLCSNATGWPRFIIRIAELHHIEGGALGLLDVEVVAAAIGVDRHIGMDARARRA